VRHGKRRRHRHRPRLGKPRPRRAGRRLRHGRGHAADGGPPPASWPTTATPTATRSPPRW
jgi:hypothetical protein